MVIASNSTRLLSSIIFRLRRQPASILCVYVYVYVCVCVCARASARTHIHTDLHEDVAKFVATRECVEIQGAAPPKIISGVKGMLMCQRERQSERQSELVKLGRREGGWDEGKERGRERRGWTRMREGTNMRQRDHDRTYTQTYTHTHTHTHT